MGEEANEEGGRFVDYVWGEDEEEDEEEGEEERGHAAAAEAAREAEGTEHRVGYGIAGSWGSLKALNG